MSQLLNSYSWPCQIDNINAPKSISRNKHMMEPTNVRRCPCFLSLFDVCWLVSSASLCYREVLQWLRFVCPPVWIGARVNSHCLWSIYSTAFPTSALSSVLQVLSTELFLVGPLSPMKLYSCLYLLFLVCFLFFLWRRSVCRRNSVLSE